MLLDRLPDDRLVDPEIVMHQDVSHAGDLAPGNGRVLLLEGRVETAHRFSDDHQMVHHPHLHERAGVESAFPLGLFCLDLGDGVEDILEAVPAVPHSGTASRRTRSRRRGLRPSSVTRSTRQPSRSCKSSSSPPRSNSEQPGRGDTSRSTSLSWVLSSRATEPKTRTFSVRYASARRRISP